MTQENYERAKLIARKLRDMNLALDAMKSPKDVTLTIDWLRHKDDVLPYKVEVVLCDVDFNNLIREYLTNRIAELEKEFEGL